MPYPTFVCFQCSGEFVPRELEPSLGLQEEGEVDPGREVARTEPKRLLIIRPGMM